MRAWGRLSGSGGGGGGSRGSGGGGGGGGGGVGKEGQRCVVTYFHWFVHFLGHLLPGSRSSDCPKAAAVDAGGFWRSGGGAFGEIAGAGDGGDLVVLGHLVAELAAAPDATGAGVQVAVFTLRHRR